MRHSALRPQFVEFIPEQLEEGVLYISQRYRTAMHRCCCGCGSEVVTPLSPADWTLEIVNGAVTLRPSVGNWSLACRSHYLIRQNSVVWARDMSRDEIERGRIYDLQLRNAHFAAVNRQKEVESQRPASAGHHADSWLARLWRAIRSWLGLMD
jgi:hypothetical protein